MSQLYENLREVREIVWKRTGRLQCWMYAELDDVTSQLYANLRKREVMKSSGSLGNNVRGDHDAGYMQSWTGG